MEEKDKNNDAPEQQTPQHSETETATKPHPPGTVASKHSPDAELESQTDNTEINSERDEPMSEGENSMESAPDSQMNSDSQVDSQAEENARGANRKSRRCKNWTPGSYAMLHGGKDKTSDRKKEKDQSKKKEEHRAKSKTIQHLKNEKEENKKKILELEAEIDVLVAQIEENDLRPDPNDQQRELDRLKDELEQNSEQIRKDQEEINELKQKIQTLERDNKKLAQENRNLKAKTAEAEKKSKKMEDEAKAAKEQKTILEQVAQDKTEEIARLKSELERLEDLSTDHQPPPTKPPITLLGDSNCRDIQPHLMTWTNQDVTKVWAATLPEAKAWSLDNQDQLPGATVVLLCGTNDLKKATRQSVNSMHKEVTQIITNAGATLIVSQLPPVYPPQTRAEARNRDTDILNEILLERHNNAVARTDNINIHRGQMRKDGLHLTGESAEIMAENISQTIIALQTDYPPPENIKVTFQTRETEAQTKEPTRSETFKTTKHIAAKVIGIGGERIRKIKTLYSVEIHTSETTEEERKFTITGASQNVTKALRIIKNVAKETDEHDKELHTRSQYTNAPQPSTSAKRQVTCRYFAKGWCKKGKNCIFLHNQGPTDAPEDSEATPSSSDSDDREPTPIRKVTMKPKTTNQKQKEQPPTKSKKKTTPPTPPEEETPYTDTESDRSPTPPRHRSKYRSRRTKTPPPPTKRHSSPQTKTNGGKRSKSSVASSQYEPRHDKDYRRQRRSSEERDRTRSPSPKRYHEHRSGERADRRSRERSKHQSQERPSHRSRGKSSRREQERPDRQSRERQPRRSREREPYQRWERQSRYDSSPSTSRPREQDNKQYSRDNRSPVRSRSRSHHRESRSNRHRQDREHDSELARAIETILYRTSRR